MFPNKNLKIKRRLIKLHLLRTEKYLTKVGEIGLRLLQRDTPKDTTETSQSWSYKIEIDKKGGKITWSNSNSSDGIPIVILLRYGHGTKAGSYIPGYDFTSRSMEETRDRLSKDIEKELA